MTKSKFLTKVYKNTRRQLATNAQVYYLQGLRTRLGLVIWNRLKAELGIRTPGTWGLSVVEASVLIQTCLEAIERMEGESS